MLHAPPCFSVIAPGRGIVQFRYPGFPTHHRTFFCYIWFVPLARARKLIMVASGISAWARLLETNACCHPAFVPDPAEVPVESTRWRREGDILSSTASLI